MTPEQAITRAETDHLFGLLLEQLAEEWAQLPADDGGELLVAACLRAAYGRGYIAALETGGGVARSEAEAQAHE